MTTKTQKKAAALISELKKEIHTLEAELSHKKQLLSSLSMFDRKPYGTGRRGGRPKGVVGRPAGRKPGRKAPTQRKSKNRDAILGAAERLNMKKFSLAELKDEILRKDPKWGGKYASGTILAALKTTPQIKKVKRGQYSYKR